MFTLKDLRRYERCKRLFYYGLKQPIETPAYIYYNTSLKKLVAQKLHLEAAPMGDFFDDNETTFAKMRAKAIVAPRFCYDDLQVKVHAMIQDEFGWNVYFAFAQLYPKTKEAQKMADTLWVLHHLGIEVSNVWTIRLNPDYVRGETLDPEAMLLVEQQLYNDKKPSPKPLEKWIDAAYRNVGKLLEGMRATLQLWQDGIEEGCVCPLGKECPYYECCACGQGEVLAPKTKPNVLVHSPTQYAQVMAQKYGRHFDQMAVHAWLSQLQSPLSYLDFEWETYAYPPYANMKVFDVLCFQYSLDIERGETLEHVDFLEPHDCREAFIQSLLEHLPPTGSIVVYNAKGGEMLRLQQLAQQFPRYEAALQAVVARIVDLSDLFTQGYVYEAAMQGSFTLKSIVKALTDVHYDDLEIQHGMKAVLAWRTLDQLEAAQQEQVRLQLLEYCRMDTLALFQVLHYVMDTSAALQQ